MADFEEYLCDKNGDIYAAAFQLLAALATPLNKPSADIVKDGDHEQYGLGWEAGMISEVVFAAEAELKKTGIYSCYPYHIASSGNNANPCYLEQGLCKCRKSGCPFKEGK